jgi:hypothetical protein
VAGEQPPLNPDYKSGLPNSAYEPTSFALPSVSVLATVACQSHAETICAAVANYPQHYRRSGGESN